jgi:alpha-D-ribose 1-methylphosphonate 5-triphosphate synthase subunit PhnL
MNEIELNVIKKDKNTYRAIIKVGSMKTYIDYNRDKVLEMMEEEDIKGRGYIGKFYEYDIKERIKDDIRGKIEEYQKEKKSKNIKPDIIYFINTLAKNSKFND